MTKEAEKNNLLGAFSIFAIAKMESSGYSGSQLTRSQGTVAFKGMSVVMSREDSSITFPLSGKNWGYERWRSFSFSLRFINQRNREGNPRETQKLECNHILPIVFRLLAPQKKKLKVSAFEDFSLSSAATMVQNDLNSLIFNFKKSPLELSYPFFDSTQISIFQ